MFRIFGVLCGNLPHFLVKQTSTSIVLKCWPMVDIGVYFEIYGIESTTSCADSVTMDYLLRVSDSKIWICDFSNLFPLIIGEGKRWIKFYT